ncbi:c-type cytochrome biogenesis protein CcmI [Methylobacterium sp. WL30]|uniref:c-type cytochrome biogenesis protein CcmI n=2 Tax=Methylobacterium TaxID=407 RepID=UPI0011CA4616|nr:MULTISPECIES: c-type cytochrome biogenesis protein CcmI [unclassified Methylobacterium]TXN49683.1 c-type cytochrome biogenesis protein CcmI [Methylobacterium sp. WL119]TXN66737.1 c-type cytochrome biogenesis protein CcmI [Methylobacterium sp. WL30]
MTAIWFILAAMTAAAVLALLWPMSRRVAIVPDAAGTVTETAFYEDQLAEIERDLDRGLIAPAEAESARTEAARRLLRASRAPAPGEASVAEPRLRQRRAASAFALSTIPLVALLAYGLYGSPDLPAQTPADRQAVQSGAQDLMKAVGQIEARLAADPNDARGWAVLAPVYMRLGRFEDAARAYAAIVRIKGETAESLSDWGEAMVAAGNGIVPEEAKAALTRALALDPKAPKPRFYLARAAEQNGDTAEAIRQLTALNDTSPADAPWLGLVRENLARLKGDPAPQLSGTPSKSAPGLPPEQRAAIQGMVDGLDERLAAKGGSADEWLRLARSRGVLGEPERAQAVLERARVALKSDPAALASLEAGARDLGLSGRPADGMARDGRSAAPPAALNATTPESRAETESAAAAVSAMPPAERDAAIRGMVAGLDRRLAAKGGSVDEWQRLVRSYSALGDPEQAGKVLSRARMALAADPGAAEKLDTLAKELGLPVRP